MVARSEGVFDPATLEAVRERLRHPPPIQDDGRPVTRWTLARIQAACPALPPRTLSGLWRLLHRHRIRLRHGRPQLYSPDPAYQVREASLHRVLRRVAANPDRCVVLFLDEFTVSHWPLVAPDWCVLPGPPPCAQRTAPGERRTRIVGALDGISGRVLSQRDSAISTVVLARFLARVAAAYPDAEHIAIVLDNWPPHHSPEILAALPASPRIELVFLPTYAPWLNPIEKLWDWLKDAVLRVHRLAGHWKELKQAVEAFLASFATGSTELLTRVGLTGAGTLARALSTDLQVQK